MHADDAMRPGLVDVKDKWRQINGPTDLLNGTREWENILVVSGSGSRTRAKLHLRGAKNRGLRNKAKGISREKNPYRKKYEPSS